MSKQRSFHELFKLLQTPTLAVTMVLALALAACQPVTAPTATASGQAQAQATGEAGLTPISIGVGYVPNVQFASYYVAMDKGYFTDEGIDASLEYGYENDYLKLVGIGERQFMIGSGDQVIIGRAQGLPVRYVMNWYTRYPVVLFAKKSAGINTPADMKGKRIGIPGPFGATYVAFRGLLDAAGLKESDVQVESIGFTQAAAISAGTVDAAVDYAVTGPITLQQAGEEITTIGLDDYLVIPSNGLVTNETTLKDAPDLVRKMVRASLRGVEYTLAHPDEAFQISLKFVPEAGGDNEAINRAIFDATLGYWQIPAGATPGATDQATWQQASEFMQKIGLVDQAPPAADLFTNDYLPK
jgi:NitT/TauT family transport system substrate-binding protein